MMEKERRISEASRTGGAFRAGEARPMRKSADERRAELLFHALESYIQLGIGRAGHGDVARRAGVSTGTVFNYFPTRDALTEAVLGHVADTVMEFYDRIPAGTPAEIVAAFRDALLESRRTRSREVELLLSWAHSFQPEVRPAYIDLQDRMDARVVALTGLSLTDARIVNAIGYAYSRMVVDGGDSHLANSLTDRLVQMLSVLTEGAPDG